MNPKIIDLRPDRNLLNSNFDGYKLSLEEIAKVIDDLDITVDRSLPNEDQYSLLHAKLFGLHNHLIGESYTDNDSIYFVDSKRHVNKMSVDPFSSSMFEKFKLWEIPAHRDKKSGDYNVSLHFASQVLAVVSDGCGVLHVVDTGKRDEHNRWQLLYSDEVIGKDKCFIVKDAVCLDTDTDNRILHCLLVSIEHASDNDKFSTVINWLTFRESNDKSWNASALRTLQGNGALQYCALEKNCGAIYIASENKFTFTADSENAITPEEMKTDTTKAKKLYMWSQRNDDVTIKFKTPISFNKESLSVVSTTTELSIKYEDKYLLNGKLCNSIDETLTTWSCGDEIIEICLTKKDDAVWKEIIEGDESGEEILDLKLVDEIHQRLAHLCSDTEVATEPCGPTFNSQQAEECDYADTKSSTLMRISCTTHRTTHSASLGSHHVLLSVNLSPDLPPALCIRHDVDACVWQPLGENESFALKHEGTLLAFGYVQASKQQRKFCSCAPDLSYSVVCESSRHLFLYRQNKAVTGGELRHRISGRRVGSVAQQQVVSIGDQEVLGLYAAVTTLYVLTENSLFALKM